MKTILSRKLLVFSFSVFVGALAVCCFERSPNEYKSIPQLDDASILPYRFEEVAVLKHFYLPADFDSDRDFESVEIQQDPCGEKPVTSIVFRDDVMGGVAINQENIPAYSVTSRLITDLDHDGTSELLIAYTRLDSIWIEIISPLGNWSYKKNVAYGEDLYRDGSWDGSGLICQTGDLNGDGLDEILIGVDVGYDLYGRGMVCLDWAHNNILWEYEIAGTIYHPGVYLTSLSKNSAPVIVFGVDSKGNDDVQTENMDDYHSYIVCLDKYGNPLLEDSTGGEHAHTRVTLIDYDSDDELEIACSFSYNDTTSEDVYLIGGGIKIYDQSAKLIDSIDLGAGKRIDYLSRADYDSDGRDEVLATLQDNTLHIYDQRMNILEKWRLNSRTELISCVDFVGRGENQLLIRSFDNKITLYNRRSEPLAQFAQSGEIYVYPHQRDGTGYGILVNSDGACSHLRLKSTPWFTVFSRYPILAFLTAFVPLSLIIAIIWLVLANFRKKNRIIAQQRDRLDAALAELKTTQDKLIAAEKFRQARDIAGGLAHEMRNALYPAQLGLTKLNDVAVPDSTATKHIGEQIRHIESAIERGIELTKLISSYTKLEEQNVVGTANIGGTLTEVVEANRARIDDLGIAVDVSGGDKIRVDMDSAHLYVVLNNLMLNSLDALTSGEQSGKITITYSTSTTGVDLTFEDNGCGIDSDDIGRVFDTFYSTKPDTGTGIGLAMVKKIVEMRGGSVAVSSSRGNGTSFSLHFLEPRSPSV